VGDTASIYQITDDCGQCFQMLFRRWAERIEPANIAEIKKKIAPRERLGEPHWDELTLGIESMCDFSLDMRRRISIF
jgi:hypothetical protein